MAVSSNGTAELAKNVLYSLGSDWFNIPTTPLTFTIIDDISSKKLLTRQGTPPAAPLGFTNMLIGLQSGGGSGMGVQVVPLNDAPEGGVCKPG